MEGGRTVRREEISHGSWRLRSLTDAKTDRILASHRPVLIDLFGGCGGLSLGFEAAGFEPAGAVETDKKAVATYASNFHRTSDGKQDPVHAIARNIMDTDPLSFLEEIGLGAGDPRMAVDVIVGGPPCQAYARIGRAKLRHEGGRPDAHLVDPRGRLVWKLLEWVEVLAPVAVVVENVPDMVNHGGGNLAAEACARLERLGYNVRYGLLNAVHYGVPQTRERLFVLALAGETGSVPALPLPARSHEVPMGYLTQRFMRIRDAFRVDAPEAREGLPPAVTVAEAVGDLPVMTGPEAASRRVDESLPYRFDVVPSWYAAAMRVWPGHGAIGATDGHVARRLPRDYPIFAAMGCGDQYPAAVRVAEAMLEEALALEEAARGRRLDPGEIRELRRSIVPPYDPGKFPNKWWKMRPDEPSRTLTAHLGKDTYSHIHYDSAQARTITVREAARLQSFPDGFQFVGGMNAAFRQIGNSVPPLLAFAIAQAVRRALGLGAAEVEHPKRRFIREATA